ncbi:hypothetical protein CCR75_006522 [Bremia lactucae]|uniref:Uncharacterized protein n=1 Tax=Bremia lactucae TaxID=4779 RepID=A0A976FPZ9_BRELC|nr:hypothetical protein CCR75_006522 [Bremia lactucae]
MENKDGQQMLSHLLAIAYHVLEETKYMNLKPPLRPISKLFAVDASASGSPPPSPSETEARFDEMHFDANGTPTSTLGAAHTNAGETSHAVVLSYPFEEIQDTYTKIATLKMQYMKISTDLLEAVKTVEVKSEPQQGEKRLNQLMRQEAIVNLEARRNQLRNEVYERNIVMKGLIDRLRHLEYSIRLMKGGSAYPPNFVMESV